ncbi:MAG: hypothetical protein WD689_02345 [Gaiellaceae bacterium]
MTIRRLLILLALVVTAVTALGAAPTAMAAKPCWVQLINDWYDGRIDKAYSVSCYRKAIRNLPEDVAAYSDAREDINRALLAALRAGERSGKPLSPGDPVAPQTGPKRTVPADTSEDAEAAPGGSPDANGGGPLDVLNPSSADSIPIPLLVLGALALLLLAAASAGFVARRIQARRVRISPGPPGPDSE